MINSFFLEPVLQKLRTRKALQIIKKYPNALLLDVGCGCNYYLLKAAKPILKKGIGMDLSVPEIQEDNLETINMYIDNKNRLPFENDTFDIVTMLAFLEHLENPLFVLLEIERILKKNGRFVLTVPSKIAKPVLEFLAYRLGIVDVKQIGGHHEYYDKNKLEKILLQADMVIEYHKYFELGMNNICVARKAKQFA